MREIVLTQGKVALVDDEDFGRVNGLRWIAARYTATGIWYATSRDGAGRTIYMHRFVLCATSPRVDHIDGDGLNNQKANLRPCTHAENLRHRRKARTRLNPYKGAYWDKSRGKWLSCIGFENRQINLGRFATAEEAARAYDEAAKRYFGEFALLNFPTQGA